MVVLSLRSSVEAELLDHDGDDDVGGVVGAVGAERLVPSRASGCRDGDGTRPGDACAAEEDGRVHPRQALAQTRRLLDTLHNLRTGVAS